MSVVRFVKSALFNRVPILTWAPRYGSDKLISDAIAGITVGLTVMPQALAYATLAGLEPQYGLYSAFVGCFVYTVFGTCKDITIGPTALMALMTYQQIVGRNTDYAILLCFLCGIVQLAMAILHLGILFSFHSAFFYIFSSYRCIDRFYFDTGDSRFYFGDICDNNDIPVEEFARIENLIVGFFGHYHQSVQEHPPNEAARFYARSSLHRNFDASQETQRPQNSIQRS
jgi:hypothetical protein